MDTHNTREGEESGEQRGSDTELMGARGARRYFIIL